MFNFDEAAAVAAPKEGSPEYLVMVCHQHMAWLTVYAEGMTQEDWRDMQDRLVSQIGKLVTDFDALSALKPFLGGMIPEGWALVPKEPTEAMITVGRSEEDNCDRESTARRYAAMIAASPDKGGE